MFTFCLNKQLLFTVSNPVQLAMSMSSMGILTESRFLKIISIIKKGQRQTPEAHLENTPSHQWSKMEDEARHQKLKKIWR